MKLPISVVTLEVSTYFNGLTTYASGLGRLCILFALCYLLSYANAFCQTATSNPSINTWKTYSGVYTCGNGSPLTGTTFNQMGGPGSGPDTAVKARVIALNDSTVTIELQKQTGTSYFQYGEVWGTHNLNNPHGFCGNVKYDNQIISNSPTSVIVHFKHYATPGNGRDMYVVYKNLITGKHYFVGAFYISVSVASSSLTGNITGLTGTWQYTKPAYITSQVQAVGGSWSGQVRLKWYDGNNNYLTYLLDSPIVNLQNNQTKSVNFTTNSIQSKAGNYIVKLEYASVGSTTYTVLDSKSITVKPGDNCPPFAVPFSLQDFNTEQCGQNCVRMCLGYFAGGSIGFTEYESR